MDEPAPEKPKVGPRTRYDWNAIETQYFSGDIDNFLTFLKKMGYPETLGRSPRASGLPDKRQRVINAVQERTRQTLLAKPFQEREQRKIAVLKSLSDAGRALQASIMNDVRKDLFLTGQKEGESLANWVERTRNVEFLSPGEKMALAVALKHADDLIRKAEGLESFDWENEERNAKAISKARKLEIEIVQTSGARPLDQLPWAPEEKREETA